MTIENINKLKQVQALLREIYVMDEGIEQQIKYINFETFSAKQANKKKISENTISITKSIKWGSSFYSINVFVITEQQETRDLLLNNREC